MNGLTPYIVKDPLCKQVFLARGLAVFGNYTP